MAKARKTNQQLLKEIARLKLQVKNLRKASHGKKKPVSRANNKSEKRPTKKLASNREGKPRGNAKRKSSTLRIGDLYYRKPQKAIRSKAVTTSYSRRIKPNKKGPLVTMRVKTTQVAKSQAVKVSRKNYDKEKLFKTLAPLAKENFKKFSKHRRKFSALSLKYRFQRKGKTYEGFYSGFATKMYSEKDTEFFTKHLINEFEENIQKYLSAGFENITIDGISMRGYELDHGEKSRRKSKVQVSNKTKSNSPRKTKRK